MNPTRLSPSSPAHRKPIRAASALAKTLLCLIATLPASRAFADGVVHIPEPANGFTGASEEGITFGQSYVITGLSNGLYYGAPVHEFGGKITLFEGASIVTLAAATSLDNDFTLSVQRGIQTEWLILQNGPTAAFPKITLDYSTGISFGNGTNSTDTSLTRSAAGVLQINGQTVVTQNALSNYVTLSGTQTLTNKSIDATQLTGTMPVGVLPENTTRLGSVIDLNSETTGTLSVAKGGTGATTLTGILKGNGTGAVTTVTAPTGALVGTTDIQTLSGKTLTSPVLSGTVSGDTNGLAFAAGTTDKNILFSTSGEGAVVVNSLLRVLNIDFSDGTLADAIEFTPGNYLGVSTQYALEFRGGESIALYTDEILLGFAGASVNILNSQNGDASSVEISPGGTGQIILNGPATISGNAVFSGTVSFASAPTVGANVIVTQNQLSSYQTTTGNGSGLTNLDASALATGTVPAARLPQIDLASTATTGDLAWARVEKTNASLTHLPDRKFSDLQDKPTTLSGYGITDSIAVTRDATSGRITSAIYIEPQGDISMGAFE